MTLAAGTKLGPYEIQSAIGAGGMGEVYRATDTRLGRDVALKILPESFSREVDRMHRFEQEARAVAALNHPNILAVFDIGWHEGSPFLVSELLEGDSLRAVLERGSLSQRKTIDYGVQIAHGLAAAHEKGIVHRDLKPENIFLIKDGRIKILDFGLAKLAPKVDASVDGVTLTSSHTAAGVVMGTAGYMAPEQVRGQPADPRTDIFAFGSVLYEMLSGARAFGRETPAETMTAVLKEDPPELSGFARPVSPAMDRIVRRCLEKGPEQRFQSARDLSFALGALSGTEASGTARVPSAPRRVTSFVWLCAVLALAAVAAATWMAARRPLAAERMQFAIPVAGEVSHMALSRDGSKLVFVSPDESSGLPVLFVQRIGSPEATLLTGTQNASYPFWSPDAVSIAYFANGKLMKIPASGGTPQVLASAAAGRGGSWGSRNVIIYAPDPSSDLWRVNADGTGAVELTGDFFNSRKTVVSHRWPAFLADGNRFLFWSGDFENARDDRFSGIYAGSLDNKKVTLVHLCHSSFGFDPHHLFYADDQRRLMSLAFDPAAATVSGSGTAIANLVGFQPSTYWAALTVGGNGTLIYNTSAGASLSVLTWMDRSGTPLRQIGEPANMANPTLSPDGNRVAVDMSDPKAINVDVWLLNANGAGNSRFTFAPEEETSGIWSRDGSMLAYRDNRAGGVTITLKRANGLEREKPILQNPSKDDLIPNSWSLDDQTILCTSLAVSGSRLATLPAAGGTLTPFLVSKANVTNGQISPNGKWVAYISDESGDWEVYVASYPGAAGKWQVSRGGGGEPRWRSDGKEIFYIAPGGMLTAVPVSNEGGFSTGTPMPLFQVHGRAPISDTDIFTYDVTKDGQRFLVNRYVKPPYVVPLNILLHAGDGKSVF